MTELEVAKIINITRYAIKSEQLTPWVKFLWKIDVPNAGLHYKLLPTDCIDIILNLANKIVYETEFEKIDAPPFHINGLRSKHSFVHQTDKICIWGISFSSYGLYPLINKSLKGLQNKVVDLYELSFSLAQQLKKAVANDSNESIVAAIEKALIDELFINQDFIENSQLISDFMAGSDNISVKSFCRDNAINIKTFERLFLHYTSYTPKVLRCIKRFQNASNQLVHQHLASLTDITYENRFTDQSHFIKEFKRFSGTSPRTFESEKITVKENVSYTYL